MKAETIFLNYVCQKLGTSVPRIIHVFEKYNVLLLEYVEGKKFSNDCFISNGDFRKVADFYYAINDNSEPYRHHFKMAIEGYSDVYRHILNIDNRLSACELSHLPKRFQLEYSKVLQNVKLEWDRLKHRIQGSIESGRIENPFCTSQLQISPGDFGFHNVVKTVKGLCFLDFEFSGLDDPAKTLCDFILHPSNRFTSKHLESVIERFSVNIEEVVLRNRVRELFFFFRMKWLTIILSVLDPNRFQNLIEKRNDMALLLNERVSRVNQILNFEKSFVG